MQTLLDLGAVLDPGALAELLALGGLLAQEDAAQQQGGLGPTLVMFGMMFAIFYFLVIRPQRQKEQQHQDMLGQLKKNDRVLTQGGIFGVVSNLNDDQVTVKVDLEKNIRMRFARSAIAKVISEDKKD